jgi:hypothetical protein
MGIIYAMARTLFFSLELALVPKRWLTTGWHSVLILSINLKFQTDVEIQPYENISTHSKISR